MSEQLHHYQDALADSYGPQLDAQELAALQDEAIARVDERLAPMDPGQAALYGLMRAIIENTPIGELRRPVRIEYVVRESVLALPPALMVLELERL